MIKDFIVKTRKNVDFVNIDSQLSEIIRKENWKNGVMHVFVPHTTAALTINENADPDVVGDIKKEINKIVPFEDNYSHFEGNSAAHLKSSIFGVDQTIFIKDSEMVLGTWQSIYFCEFDGPRQRNVIVKFISD